MGLQNNTISMDRLNDAVARILAVKLALGIVDTISTQIEDTIKTEIEDTSLSQT